ncbi:MAG: HAMP domain-containing histidine kinase [Anaerolineae bacterium]|nr:HAMP domain-containing histidine kinase [Anaerolineae bacterium]
MSQLDAKPNQDETVLRHVLHIIANTPNPVECLAPILEAGRQATGAVGAAFISFSDPLLIKANGLEETQLPDLETFKALAIQHPTAIHLNPVLGDGSPLGHAIFAAIRAQRNVVAALWLTFETPLDEVPSSISALVDGLTIVTANLRQVARHEKIARNQSDFLRIVSHDLRSPLTSMQGFGSMLESGMVGELNERQAYFVEKMLSGITQIASLVDNIQDAGRYDPETGFYEMQRSPCDLIGIVHKIVSNHLVPAEKQELTINSQIADNVPIINADSNMLERAVTNLVDNAIKYTPNGGTITLSLYRQDDHIIIGVQDTGLGISPENQKLLFERHVRIPRIEHKKVKGSGLGLFIVRSVAQRHGGNAWVESSEGEGSTFFISIPLNGENELVSSL